MSSAKRRPFCLGLNDPQVRVCLYIVCATWILVVANMVHARSNFFLVQWKHYMFNAMRFGVSNNRLFVGQLDVLITIQGKHQGTELLARSNGVDRCSSFFSTKPSNVKSVYVAICQLGVFYRAKKRGYMKTMESDSDYNWRLFVCFCHGQAPRGGFMDPDKSCDQGIKSWKDNHTRINLSHKNVTSGHE